MNGGRVIECYTAENKSKQRFRREFLLKLYFTFTEYCVCVLLSFLGFNLSALTPCSPVLSGKIPLPTKNLHFQLYIYPSTCTMKPLCLILLAFPFSLSAQILSKNQAVEVNTSLSDSAKIIWKKAVVTDVDTVAKKYTVKLADDSKMNIPSTSPEKWIRPDAAKLAMLGPDKQIRYESSVQAIKGFSCRPSEVYIKKSIKAKLAEYFKDYNEIFVDHTSFKAQNGYEDPKIKGRFVYPYKIEMRVFLKRTVLFAGKPYYEYQTWEFDRVYEYATRGKKQCELYPVPANDAKLLSSGWYQ